MLLRAVPDERAEAAFVAAEIERLRTERRLSCLDEVAILYRTRRQASELALALRAARLPYQLAAGEDLFSRSAVRDVLAYLRLAHNPADAAALTRIVNVPPRRLGRLVPLLKAQPSSVRSLRPGPRRWRPSWPTSTPGVPSSPRPRS